MRGGAELSASEFSGTGTVSRIFFCIASKLRSDLDSSLLEPSDSEVTLDIEMQPRSDFEPSFLEPSDCEVTSGRVFPGRATSK